MLPLPSLVPRGQNVAQISPSLLALTQGGFIRGGFIRGVGWEMLWEPVLSFLMEWQRLSSLSAGLSLPALPLPNGRVVILPQVVGQTPCGCEHSGLGFLSLLPGVLPYPLCPGQGPFI